MDKIKNISPKMGKKYYFYFSVVLNIVFFAILMFPRVKSSDLEISSRTETIASLDKQIEQKTGELENLQSLIKNVSEVLPIEDEDGKDLYSLDRSIWEVKFRSVEQREIWIERNNGSANFSEELIAWLRSHDTFYVSEIVRFYNKKVVIDPDSFIILPPCPVNLQDGTQPILYKTRTTVIREVNKETYLAANK